MNTISKQIAEIENQILRIEHNESNIVGGAKAYHSGCETSLKPAAQKKVDKLNAQLDKLFDLCEA